MVSVVGSCEQQVDGAVARVVFEGQGSGRVVRVVFEYAVTVTTQSRLTTNKHSNFQPDTEESHFYSCTKDGKNYKKISITSERIDSI